ncbi:MAG: hypothetical protein K0R34_4159, partial [Herbinix sp.]|nr:hypothetical protein [Herbinix sp.]
MLNWDMVYKREIVYHKAIVSCT